MFEEKKTDVNIACQILNDTYLDRYDLCYLVSGDSDLAPPLQIVKENHSDKRVLVVHPPRRKSVELCGIADGWFAIGEQKLKALYGFGTANVAANREGNPRESKSPLPRFLALWTNSKKPRYKGRCSWEIPRCGRSQERSKDQNPSIVLT